MLKGFGQMYIFSALCFLFCVTIWFMIKEATGADTMAVMTAAMGGILSNIGIVVSHYFRDKREQPQRSSDPSAAGRGVTGGAPTNGAGPSP